MSCVAVLPLATIYSCFFHLYHHPNLWTSNVVLPVAEWSEGVGELGAPAVHHRLSSQTMLIASLAQKFGVVWGTMEASSQHRGQCQHTAKVWSLCWPHLRRVFHLLKWPCSWLGAPGRSFSSVSETSYKPFWCFLLPMFYGVIKILSLSKTSPHVLFRWLCCHWLPLSC